MTSLVCHMLSWVLLTPSDIKVYMRLVSRKWERLKYPSSICCLFINDCSSFFCFPFDDDVIPRYLKGMSLVRTLFVLFSVDDDIICNKRLAVELI